MTTRRPFTPDELKNAMAYGVCLICRSPRVPEKTKSDGGTVTIRIVCPNGHPQ